MLRAQPPLALIPASVVPPLVAAGELEELAFDRTALAMDPIGALYRQEEESPGAGPEGARPIAR